MKFIDPSEALVAGMFGSIRSLLSDINSGDIDYVYLPYNNSGTRWILGVVDVRLSAVIFLDLISVKYQPSNKSQKGGSLYRVRDIQQKVLQGSNSCNDYQTFIGTRYE